MEYSIKRKRHYVEIVDKYGDFVCSEDNYSDAVKEIERLKAGNEMDSIPPQKPQPTSIERVHEYKGVL